MRPAYLSASQINLFLSCPMKYRLRYVDRAEPAFKASALVLGSAVHTALEWLHKRWQQQKRPSAAALLSIFDADLSSQDASEIRYRKGETPQSIRSLGQELLDLYLVEKKPSLMRSIELPFEVPLVDPGTGATLDVPLLGWIDAIEMDGTVVELKTAARLPDQTTLAINPQFSAYSYAVTRIHGRRPSLRVDCLLKTKKPRLESLHIKRTEVHDARLFRLARDILAAIEAKSFFPSPSWFCSGCEYRHACSIWGS